jgi:hypothetical protein
MRATTPSVRQVGALLVVLGLLLAACGSSDEGAEEGPLRLVFDGESCNYEGPTELKAGPVTIDLVNESEATFIKMNLTRHTGEETIQDAIDYIGPEPSTRTAPLWVENMGTWSGDYAAWADKPARWEGDLEAGTYHLVCAVTVPVFSVWFGTGLIVED